MFIKKFIRWAIISYQKNQFKNKAVLGNNIIFNRKSKIINTKRKNIIISNNVLMFGLLQSKNDGVIKIGSNTSIRTGCKIFCAKEIKIGTNVIFADNVIISDTNHHPTHPDDRKKMIQSGWSTELWSWKYGTSKAISIGNNVWLGQYSRVTKGVKIGENSIVASNAVVTKDVPPNSIAAGNPAKIVKTNIQEETRRF
ncbi:acyltransferase [Mesonia sp. MT50]|uniref:Acyltransferase n=1 Tax=Mesonia profundi TaxID=3070998 RepID=A0ABU1A5W9_9FLAO|nr:acyltransferase [Mesonia profundi]MDQ7918281.1 acyltransferase [Mesonia profundi]